MDFSSDVGKTVAEWVDATSGSHGFEFDEQIRTYGDRKIVRVFDGRDYAFPQRDFRYRNVMTWILLDDGSAVGFNESPRSGFSFPRAGKKITDTYLAHFRRKDEFFDDGHSHVGTLQAR